MPDNTIPTSHPEMSLIRGKPIAITVVIPTYNRPEILKETIMRLDMHLKFQGQVRYIIGNDGDEPIEFDETMLRPGHTINIVASPQKGLGANLNFLLSLVETNIVMQLDDDHWLNRPLDVTDYARDLLKKNLNIGWIRLFMGEREDVYKLKSYYRMKSATYGPYWILDTESPELYLASNRPHIKRISFHISNFGWYPENRTLGKTEEAWCHQYKKLRNDSKSWGAKPWVAVPMFGLALEQWHHVGDSWQDRGL